MTLDYDVNSRKIIFEEHKFMQTETIKSISSRLHI